MKQECIPAGCVPSAAVAVASWGGVTAQGRVCLGEGWVGVCLVCPEGVWQTSHLWTEFLTHTCENITFPQLRLRTVISFQCFTKKYSYLLMVLPDACYSFMLI